MAVTTLVAEVATADLPILANTYTDLLPQATVTGTGNAVQLSAHVKNLPPLTVQVRILIDGVDVLEATAGDTITYMTTLTAASHTINYQAYAFAAGGVAKERALTVINLA